MKFITRADRQVGFLLQEEKGVNIIASVGGLASFTRAKAM